MQAQSSWQDHLAKGFHTIIGRCLESEAIVDLERFLKVGDHLTW
jgi:hypothetical protein